MRQAEIEDCTLAAIKDLALSDENLITLCTTCRAGVHHR